MSHHLPYSFSVLFLVPIIRGQACILTVILADFMTGLFPAIQLFHHINENIIISIDRKPRYKLVLFMIILYIK